MSKKIINYDIIHTEEIITDLSKFINENSYSKIYLLTDNNCIEKCFPKIKDVFINNIPIYVLQEGEENKSVNSLREIWNFLIKNAADRNSLLINLGGGIVTDIGGFAASTFKRGIDFVNIPTTLLSQVDASVGGKTGVNFGGFKNEIGIFNKAKKVFIYSNFLETLKEDEFLSGFAEMIKHALIFDESYFEELKSFYFRFFKSDKMKISNLIKKSVEVKEHFVKNDITDKGIRQTLNFGHTFGHAFESYFQKNKIRKIKHGDAVAFGMICELFISQKILNFPFSDFYSIANLIKEIYGSIRIIEDDFEMFFNLMLHDKKNVSQEIRCVLLQEIAKPKFNVTINKNYVFEGLKFLNSI